jgi:hypothetical protein
LNGPQWINVLFQPPIWSWADDALRRRSNKLDKVLTGGDNPALRHSHQIRVLQVKTKGVRHE